MRVRLAMLVLAACVLIGGAAALAPERAAWAAGSPNGVAGSMPAYYDHVLFTINFKQLSAAEATLLAKNSQQNVIYQSDPGLPGGQPFVSVIDAVPADGMNPLWAEVQIAFTAGHTPRQLFSDDEIAAAAASGEITLTATNEMYRCSVIGKPGAPTSSRIVGNGSSPTPARSTHGATWGAIKKAYR
ncbi:MAG: hypothetical protein E6K72_00580 [Candidatus Eisenbacteria bacterium]|uniref:Uncharacterized protein n=1 Tax=Eiseniibacteriota bacterium TaxID=2212470 RepID=A0A538TA65_UNCEI|nr:MAG: hypothetical protein E6K72_00580 [Candidatus Eisenbacteria bacterium]